MRLSHKISSPVMQKPKHIVIVAGEESGDYHAAAMVGELLQKNPSLRISGIGGKHMQNAGVELIMNLAKYGVTGISEVLSQIFIIKKAFSLIKTHLKTVQPDLLILVDYPGFNLRLAQFAKQQLNLRIVYYISPQIWAWKAGRIKTIQKTIDRMAVILPFEKKIYENAGVPVSFVGHPLAHKIPKCNDIVQKRLQMQLQLPEGKQILALLPGSRLNEIKRHMPTLVQTVIKLHKKFPDLYCLIPIAETIDPTIVQQYFEKSTIPISFLQGKALDAIAASDCVIVASGTASLEAALCLKPMCIIYKSSFFSYYVGMKLIKVKYLGLANLLQNKMIVPEFLQNDCNSDELSKTVENLLTSDKAAQQMIHDLRQLKQSLSAETADCSISGLIMEELA